MINITEPDAAFFGQKDAQQAIIIRKMAQDLNLPTRIEVTPTIREKDGLALSSRNAYLSDTERTAAQVIYRALLSARNAFSAGEHSPDALLETARAVLETEPLLHLEYVELVNMETLEPLTGTESDPDWLSALLAVAGRIGKTRLIDNVILGA